MPAARDVLGALQFADRARDGERRDVEVISEVCIGDIGDLVWWHLLKGGKDTPCTSRQHVVHDRDPFSSFHLLVPGPLCMSVTTVQ